MQWRWRVLSVGFKNKVAGEDDAYGQARANSDCRLDRQLTFDNSLTCSVYAVSRAVTNGTDKVCQQPGTANGVIFVTLQDESGDANIIVWEKVGEAHRQALYGSSLMLVTGFIQREGECVRLIARSIVDLSHMLAEIGDRDTALKPPHQPGNEFRNDGPYYDHRV